MKSSIKKINCRGLFICACLCLLLCVLTACGKGQAAVESESIATLDGIKQESNASETAASPKAAAVQTTEEEKQIQSETEEEKQTASEAKETNGEPGTLAPDPLPIDPVMDAAVSAAFGKEEAARKAEDLFDQHFAEAVRAAGREKETVVYDFNGNTWFVTVRLLDDGLDTGYYAGLDFSADGTLLSSSYITGEEDRPQILITAEQAILLAQEALLQDCRERYGESVVLHFEQAKDVACHYRVWAAKGQHYWEIESLVPTENMGPWENYELYSAIRIDSQTGECLMIATPLK